mmetsp:Transcript_16358/g.39902  ORF Transcript_16358/g.39902 Transcript_16358/m.39902 type:complete len:329 (+) Transcript_16358:725-1711(+)
MPKRRVPTQKDVQDNTRTPHVTLLSISLPRQHFGSYVVWRAASRPEAHATRDQLLALDAAAEAKVADLDGRVVSGCGVEHVLGLEVSVHHPPRVQVIDRTDDLSKHLGSFRFGIVLLPDDALEELPARHKLHHDVDVLGRLVHPIVPDAVRVVDLRHDLDLAQRKLELILAVRVDLWQDLDGNSLPCLAAHGRADDPILASAQCVALDVVVLPDAALRERHEVRDRPAQLPRARQLLRARGQVHRRRPPPRQHRRERRGVRVQRGEVPWERRRPRPHHLVVRVWSFVVGHAGVGGAGGGERAIGAPDDASEPPEGQPLPEHPQAPAGR